MTVLASGVEHMPSQSTFHNLDTLDKELIKLLKQDARASVSKLSTILNVSRGTVQNRIDRLLETGAILGFTIRSHENLESGRVKAVMMLEVVGKSTTQAIAKLRSIPQLNKLHTTNGSWDLVAEISAASLEEFDLVLREVRSLDAISKSETSILLSSI